MVKPSIAALRRLAFLDFIASFLSGEKDSCPAAAIKLSMISPDGSV